MAMMGGVSGLGAEVTAQDWLDYDGPIKCPTGSDYVKSVEMGMCVGPGYGAMLTTDAKGQQYVYDLGGTKSLVEGSGKPKSTSLIPGVPDTYLIIGAVVLGFMLLLGRRR